MRCITENPRRPVDPRVVCVRGSLDLTAIADLRAGLGTVVVGRDVVIDLSEAAVADPVGVGCLIGGIRHVRDMGGAAVIVGVTPEVARVLHTSGVDRVARVVPCTRRGRRAR
jgi:anti-anti-sigma factor